MRQFHVITIHPDFISSYQSFGAFRQAAKNNLAKVNPINLRDFAIDHHGSVDAAPFGGGESMVLRPEPLAAAVNSLGSSSSSSSPAPYVILPSPSGKVWTQKAANDLAAFDPERPIIFVCGRFGGVDQRFIDRYVDSEYSLGDFVLAGGELAALCMIESVLRQIPGVLGNWDSACFDSFSPHFAGRLEHPLYTKPEIFEGLAVPPVLRSGHHALIARWKKDQSIKQTRLKRADLLDPSDRKAQTH